MTIYTNNLFWTRNKIIIRKRTPERARLAVTVSLRLLKEKGGLEALPHEEGQQPASIYSDRCVSQVFFFFFFSFPSTVYYTCLFLIILSSSRDARAISPSLNSLPDASPTSCLIFVFKKKLVLFYWKSYEMLQNFTEWVNPIKPFSHNGHIHVYLLSSLSVYEKSNNCLIRDEKNLKRLRLKIDSDKNKLT